MRHSLFVVILLGMSTIASGQVPELGLGMSRGCVGNYTIITGLSTRVGEFLQLKGGVRLHNFAGEETSTTEVFFSAGYRFGGR